MPGTAEAHPGPRVQWPGVGRAGVLLVGLLVCGCGYRAGSLVREDISTVAVPVMENLTFRRGLELDLTRAVKDQLRQRTHLRQVPVAEAETVLLGTIVDVEERVLSEGRDDEVLEERITVTVRVQWTRANGEPLLALPALRGSATVATGLDVAVAGGTREALEDLAERIVLHMESSW